MKFLILIVSLIFIVSSCREENSSHDVTKKESNVETFYTCSMHPQIKEDKPGKCPICAMGLTKIEIDHDHSSLKELNNPSEVYYCESDSTVTSEVAGECPLDGTPMLKKSLSMETVARVKLRKSQVSHFRAETFETTTMKMEKRIRLLGTLLKSEEKQSNIPARVPGRVEKIFVQSTGSFIKKGDPVLKLYSPQLLTGADEYLIARKNYLANKQSKDFKELFQQSIQRLKLWGVQEFQLEAWAKSKKVPREISIYSPVTGIVEKKNAVIGKYFKEGQSFFDLVDLSSLWVEMDVYEHDSALISIGQNVELQFNAYPGEVWKGKVDFINPVLDKKTRTLKVRTTLLNELGKLRPGMAGVASVTLKLEGMPLVIPRSAIIDTGKRKVVWLEIAKGRYKANVVYTGFESEGFVEIKQGLEEGDKVVIDGNFLLDAQAQLFGGYSK